MAINTDLLISAAILQDYFVDKDTGEALSAGVITFYKDNARNTLKNVYYQTGAPGSYSYITLPNPMTLTNVGTIADANGNDVIPFWYPYNESDSSIREPYYIVVKDSDGETQFTRANFPFNPGGSSSGGVSTNNNLICNNEFWRNIGSVDATDLTNSIDINGTPVFYTTLAPSQHDGFTMPDINFFKDDNGAVDTLTFEKFVDSFSDQVIDDCITPEYYLNVQCTGTGPETQKYIQIPIQLHVDALSGVPTCTITLAAMAATGSPNITVGVYQFLGSGVTSPNVSIIETFTLSNSWTKYTTISFAMPTAQGLTLGTGQDDAFYLQIGFDTDITYEINIALPSFYLSDSIPTNDFQTYDQINAIISSPRTGDVRISMNEFQPFGWVAMNDGTIGYNPDVMAAYLPTGRNDPDTWPLYNLLWNKFSAYTSGSTNLLAQLKDDTGANVAYGASAIGDFDANKSLTLSQTMGKVLLGTVPVSQLLTGENKAYTTTFVASDSGGDLLLTLDEDNNNLFNGCTFYVDNDGGALPAGLTANTIYYVSGVTLSSPTTFFVSTSFANAMAGTVVASGALGSGTQTYTSCFNGTFEGEYSHMQLLDEMKNHTHDAPPGAPFVTSTSPGTIYQGAVNLGTGSGVTSTITGFPVSGQTAFNVTQPGLFINMYMKL